MSLDIDVVVVGRDCSETLRACLESVLANQYTRGELRLFYVDRASSDDSVEIARAFPGCSLVEMLCNPLDLACAHDAGWKAGGGALVQFLNADALLHPEWFQVATKELTPQMAAVAGQVEFMGPEGSYWDWVARVDEQVTPGPLPHLGHTFLARRTALAQGLSRVQGVGLSAPMAKVQLEPQGFGSWWRRNLALGRGMSISGEIFWRGLTSCVLLLLTPIFWPFFFGALFFLFYPRIFGLHKLERELGLSHHDAARYSWQRGFAVIPQLFGAIRSLVSRRR